MSSQQRTQTSKCEYCEEEFKSIKPKMYCSRLCTNNSFRVKRRELVSSIKLSRGCKLCGYKEHSAALHFDHRNPDTKSFNISQDVKRKWEDILLEIEKCDILCANCHSVETYKKDHYNVRK